MPGLPRSSYLPLPVLPSVCPFVACEDSKECPICTHPICLELLWKAHDRFETNVKDLARNAQANGKPVPEPDGVEMMEIVFEFIKDINEMLKYFNLPPVKMEAIVVRSKQHQ